MNTAFCVPPQHTGKKKKKKHIHSPQFSKIQPRHAHLAGESTNSTVSSMGVLHLVFVLAATWWVWKPASPPPLCSNRWFGFVKSTLLSPPPPLTEESFVHSSSVWHFKQSLSSYCFSKLKDTHWLHSREERLTFGHIQLRFISYVSIAKSNRTCSPSWTSYQHMSYVPEALRKVTVRIIRTRF